MLKITLDKEGYEALSDDLKAEYKQDGDSYKIQVDGMKTPEDVQSALADLKAEREQRKQAEKDLKAIKREKDELTDKVSAYESDENLKLSQEEKVEFQRLKRENETITADKDELNQKYEGLQVQLTSGKIKEALSAAAKGVVRDEAIGDVVSILANDFVLSDGKVLTSEKLGDKAGLEAKAYVQQYAEDRSYLTPQSSGGGAGGGKGPGGGSQNNQPKTNECTSSRDLWGS
jgi:hypothetical protein